MAHYPYMLKRRSAFRLRGAVKKLFFWVFLVVGIAGAGTYLFSSTDVFLVDRIEVHGITATGDIHEAVRGYLGAKTALGFGRNNYFLLSPKNLQGVITQHFPALASVAVSKKFPRSVLLNVRERQYAGVWCRIDSPQCYLVDTQGVLYHEAASSSGTLIMVVRSSLPQGLGDEVLDSSTLASLALIRNTLRERFGFAVKDFLLDDLPDVTASIAGDWRLLFDVSRSPIQTFDALGKVMAAIGSGADKKIEYIDLRIDNRVYYKTIPETKQ